MTVNLPDDCVVMSREKLQHIRDELGALKARVMEAFATMQGLVRERDEARVRCRALDAVETDLWTFAGEVMRSLPTPHEIRAKAAALVLKYDALNPPDLPWLNQRTPVKPATQPDLFAPCYNPPGWIDPETDPDAE